MSWEEDLINLGRAVDRAAEVAAAEGLKRALTETIRAGEDPDGEAWEKTEDGGRALSGATSAVQYQVGKGFVRAIIGPPYVYHNHGAGGSSQTKGAKKAKKWREKKRKESGESSKFHSPKRQILPDAITPRISAEILKAFRKHTP